MSTTPSLLVGAIESSNVYSQTLIGNSTLTTLNDMQIPVYEEEISNLAKSDPNAIDATVTITSQLLTSDSNNDRRKLQNTQFALTYAIVIRATSISNTHKYFVNHINLIDGSKETVLNALQKAGAHIFEIDTTISLGSIPPSLSSGSNHPTPYPTLSSVLRPSDNPTHSIQSHKPSYPLIPSKAPSESAYMSVSPSVAPSGIASDDTFNFIK